MKVLLFLTVLMFASSCDQNQTDKLVNCKATSGTFEIVTAISIDYAENFTIIPLKDGYQVELIDPNTHIIERSYVFTYDQSKKGESIVHLPLENITAFSQTTIGMMSNLKALDQLSGILNINYVFDPQVKNDFKNGRITEFKDESNFSIEKVIEAKTSIIIYSGFSREFPQEKKLSKFNIVAIPDYDWRETHPLGRAEWIKFVGVLCGKLTEANELFHEIETKYKAMSAKVQMLIDRPSVVSGNFRGDQWTAPAGNSYMAILFNDAGADYIYRESKGTGSIFKSMERIILDTEATDFWINPGFSSNRQIIEANPKGKYVGPYKTKQVFCYSHEMNQYWERTAVEPHLLLSDFIHIFHPEIELDEAMHFYKKLED